MTSKRMLINNVNSTERTENHTLDYTLWSEVLKIITGWKHEGFLFYKHLFVFHVCRHIRVHSNMVFLSGLLKWKSPFSVCANSVLIIGSIWYSDQEDQKS